MKTAGQRFPTLVAIWATLSVGCASSYPPQEPGRIHVVLAEGRRALEKDGKLYSMSWFSNDPIVAVAGHPVAEEHARTFVNRRRNAAVMILFGVASMLAGGALITNEPGHTGQRGAAIGIICVSELSLIGGLIAFSSTKPHLYDAINIYNDDVSRRRQTGLPMLEPPTLQPGVDALVGSARQKATD
jgi:hypothetical protein